MSVIVRERPESNSSSEKSFVVDSLTTEFKAMARLAIAPLLAVFALSLKPMRDAFRHSRDESKKLIDRHSTAEPR